jgi:3'-phosphoadenosine 5'-phosphosulfate sulfotransferase (PAPS reductase)/FAD synthetase
MSEPIALFEPEPDHVPDLSAYDVILVASSAGKDSQAMLDYVAELVRGAGVEDRVTVLHNNLGEVEWPGTEELAREQAEHYGFRFEMRHRIQGLLLEQVEDRGMWPSSNARYCTSDQKRGPSRKLITQLVGEAGLDRQARVLYCLGLRAQESSGRAKKPVLAVDPSASSRVREVTTWLPILHWSGDDVWARIKASGVRHHWAYDRGMKRLSCSFCVLASREDLECAARLRPDMAAKYVALEARIGHQFKADLSMAEIVASAGGGGGDE